MIIKNIIKRNEDLNILMQPLLFYHTDINICQKTDKYHFFSCQEWKRLMQR